MAYTLAKCTAELATVLVSLMQVFSPKPDPSSVSPLRAACAAAAHSAAALPSLRYLTLALTQAQPLPTRRAESAAAAPSAAALASCCASRRSRSASAAARRAAASRAPGLDFRAVARACSTLSMLPGKRLRCLTLLRLAPLSGSH